jgi:hypothetical protein
MLFYRGDALKFNGNGSWQAVDFDRGTARLIGAKVFGVQSVEGVEITFHIHEEYGHINQLVPTRAACFQDGLDVLKHTVHLGFEIKSFKISVVIQFQPRNTTVVRVASGRSRPYTAKEEQVAYSSCMGVQTHGFRGI